MQKTGGQRSRDQRGGDRDRDRDRDRADKDGFRSALPRPDTGALKRDIGAHDKEIAACNKELNEIKSKQDKIRNERNGGRQEFDKAKKLMSKLMDNKKNLHAEKNAIEARREASHKKITAGQDKEKAARAEIKFGSVDAIDKKIKELETRQARTSMSLTEEKNLVKEIKTLNLSKKGFAALVELKAVTDRERALKSGIDKELTQKNIELKGVYKEIDAQKAVLDALNKSSLESSKHLPAFKKRQEELRAQIETANAAVKTLREQIKEKEAVHATAVAEEKKVWKAEQAEIKKKLEAEELAKHPYEEEMYVCDFLVKYLSTKCVVDADSKMEATSLASTTATVDTSAFAGMKSLKRDDDESFMGGAIKKKSKKKGGQNNKDDITHTHESLEYFSSISVKAPLKLSSVTDSLKELEEKKEYFNTLERGAIPSLKSLRAKKGNGEVKPSGGKSDGKKNAAKTVFNLESKADYPGL
mmetsp:Transcript_9845/g.16344  ORF Transcript_9845/g.16344 Transcript_9845/m.16344 type:complete len:472 (+) Transcript_9845:76-1491(+)